MRLVHELLEHSKVQESSAYCSPIFVALGGRMAICTWPNRYAGQRTLLMHILKELRQRLAQRNNVGKHFFEREMTGLGWLAVIASDAFCVPPLLYHDESIF